jgi:methylated-DNA-[protein]-cysteine S-methyltransferase
MSREMMHVFKTKWGWCGLAASARGLKRVIIPWRNSRRDVLAILRAEFPAAREDARALSNAAKSLRKYFAGEQVKFDFPLDLDGLTAFQKNVLAATRKISYGRTLAYGEVAARANRPGAARAAGTALARNPLPIVIPCHRVLASGGRAGGFSARGGVKTKIALLRLEAKKQKSSYHRVHREPQRSQRKTDSFGLLGPVKPVS